jgi:hypothetical protein
MTAEVFQYNYNDRVFINCPFDELYQPLFRAAIFAVYQCGFYPTSSLAEENGLDNRIDKITRIIEQCRYGIHDISRTQTNDSGWPRFNMPFELGLFYGARRFGYNDQTLKNALILERKPYSYQHFISDINGIDTHAHENSPCILVHHVRNWLNTNSKRKNIPGADTIWINFQSFLDQFPIIANSSGFINCDQVPFDDFCGMVEEWVKAAGQFKTM